VKKPFDPDHSAQPGHGGIGRLPEEIHTGGEEDGIEDTGDEDPFPKVVLADEVVRLDVGLESYNNFFEQGAFLFVNLFA
jgi:hypothetical protein